MGVAYQLLKALLFLSLREIPADELLPCGRSGKAMHVLEFHRVQTTAAFNPPRALCDVTLSFLCRFGLNLYKKTDFAQRETCQGPETAEVEEEAEEGPSWAVW